MPTPGSTGSAQSLIPMPRMKTAAAELVAAKGEVSSMERPGAN
jgi:hypothetical protein